MSGWCGKPERDGSRGQSSRDGAASHPGLASADRLLLPRDVGGDAVGVTSVLPVVTSLAAAILKWAGLQPGHYISLRALS
jgi:hypothetical protein